MTTSTDEKKPFNLSRWAIGHPSIARFLVEKMNRFSRFKGRDFNSHSPSAVRQRRMVAAFEPIRATLDLGRQLSASQIIEILEAGRA